MITGYFGIPGCGKTTLLSKIAQKELKRIQRGRSKYKAVYTNFACSGCIKIDFTDIGVYDIQSGLILLDEITVDADNRDFKNFKKTSVEGFVYHRHYYNDIVYATQQYDAVDKKIRNLTQYLYYLRSGYILPISKYKRVFRTLEIQEQTKEIVIGYRFATFWEAFLSIFVPQKMDPISGRVFRPRYYQYFDSHVQPLKLIPFKEVSWDELENLPSTENRS